jgi:hypothetical protein
VATVLSELSEKLDPAALVKLADLYATPDVQRIGYLLEKLGRHDLSKPLAGWLVKRRYRPIALVPGIGAENIAADPKWRVFPNEEVGNGIQTNNSQCGANGGNTLSARASYPGGYRCRDGSGQYEGRRNSGVLS